MTDEPINRRRADERIDQIQSSVQELGAHQALLTRRIDDGFSAVSSRLDQLEQRVSDSEARGIETRAEQKSLEKVHASEIARLSDKLDSAMREVHSKIDTAMAAVHNKIDNAATGIHELASVFSRHDERETNDRGKLFWTLVTILVAIVGFVGSRAWHHLVGTP